MARLFAGINCDVQSQIPMIVIFNSPKDYPGKFVGRLWDLDKPTQVLTVKDTLEDVRNEIPFGFINIGRHVSDDPVIVEVWI